jgi:cell division protease FtsH
MFSNKGMRADWRISDDVMRRIVSGAKGVSAAFIKKLMRRCAQFQIESSAGNVLTHGAVDAALEEMLFAGGSLNRRLLGAEESDSFH